MFAAIIAEPAAAALDHGQAQPSCQRRTLMREAAASATSSAVDSDLANTFGRFADASAPTEREAVMAHDKSFTTPVNVNHQNCRFGKWYLGEGKELFGSYVSYKALDLPHAKVHDDAHQVLAQLGLDSENNVEVQIGIMNGLQQLEQGSREVMELLDRMVAEKHPSV